MKKTDLSSFKNPDFNRGASLWKELGWMMVSALFFRHSLAVGNKFKVILLRSFGAKLGKKVIIKPDVQIKFPWKLTIGNQVWIGEGVWIDNLQQVSIGDNVCLSQGAMLLCGNHDYKKSSFDLIAKPIVLEEGVWIGTKSIVCPGVTCKSHSILAVQSVANKDLAPFSIYQGNPAKWIRSREITS